MQKEHRPTRGWVLYDGECGICIALAARWQPRLERKGYTLTPLQEPWAASLLGPRVDELCLIHTDASVSRGVDALLEIGRGFWWVRPFTWPAKVPLVRSLLRKAYHHFTQRRRCFDGLCSPSPGTEALRLQPRNGI